MLSPLGDSKLCFRLTEFDKKRKLQNSLSNTEYPKGEESYEKNVADVTVDKVFKLRTDRLVDRQQIPIYDMEAVAGLVPLFADQYSQSIVGSWRRH